MTLVEKSEVVKLERETTEKVTTQEEENSQNDTEQLPENTTEQTEIEDTLAEKFEQVSIAPKSKLKSQIDPERVPLEVVRQVLNDWFTLDTLKMLKGDEFVGELLTEAEYPPEIILKALGDPNLKDPEMRRKHLELCRKLELIQVIKIFHIFSAKK